MFQIRDLNKIYSSKYDKVHALKNINIDFGESGLIFVVGKTGSGKSTLLNLLGGLDNITSGEVIIDGFSTSKFKQSDFDAFRNFFIGFVFQDFNLIDEVNVFENIATVLKLKKEKYDFSTIEDALKMVGLEGLGYRMPSELSGGQRQRIAIARALVKNPKIILADEPTGALDYQTGRDLISSLKSLAAKKLVIVVTHDKDLAIEFGDRILELKEGEIINDRLVKETDKTIIELKQGLFKLSSNVFLNENSVKKLNKKFSANKENYLCINRQIDKAALGYSENFDQLYNQKVAEDRFEKANKNLQEIKYRQGYFPKAGIKLNQLLNMAYLSIMRKKLRFIFSTLFVTIALIFISTSIALTTFSVGSVSATAIKDYDLPLANLKYGQSSDFSVFPQEVLNDLDKMNFHYTKNYNLNISFMGLNNTINYTSGLAEVKDFTKFDLKLLDGHFPTAQEEILITDSMAYILLNNGYLGLDKNDNFLALQPANITDILNTYIQFDHYNCPSLFAKITGVIDTDFIQYYRTHDFSYFASNYFGHIYIFDGARQHYQSMALLEEIQVSSIFIDAQMSKSRLTSLLNKLKNKSIYLNIAYYDVNELYKMQQQIADINKISLIAVIIFSALAFLLIFTFVSSAIRARKKEIGILRANGAKASNIFSIFMIETIIMAIFVLIISSVITSQLIVLSNAGYLLFADYSTLTSSRIISYSLLNFFLSGFILFLFILIATSLPLFKIIRQRPVDAITRE